MKCKILHESHGRMRVHLFVKRMTLDEADILEYHLRAIDGVTNVKVFDRTQDVIIQYQSDRATVIKFSVVFLFFYCKHRLGAGTHSEKTQSGI